MTQDRSFTSAQKHYFFSKRQDKDALRTTGCWTVFLYSPLLLPLTLALRNGDAPSYLFAYWLLLRIGQGRISILKKKTKSLFKF